MIPWIRPRHPSFPILSQDLCPNAPQYRTSCLAGQPRGQLNKTRYLLEDQDSSQECYGHYRLLRGHWRALLRPVC